MPKRKRRESLRYVDEAGPFVITVPTIGVRHGFVATPDHEIVPWDRVVDEGPYRTWDEAEDAAQALNDVHQVLES